MKPSLNITKNFDLKKIKFDLTKELNIGGFIVRQDHIDRLDRGLGVDGRAMQKLKKSTVKAKGSNQILVDTDKMRRLNVKKATPTKQIVLIEPGAKRRYPKTNVTPKQVGGWHQEGAGNLPKREWFGISKTAEKRVIKQAERKIRSMIKNA